MIINNQPIKKPQPNSIPNNFPIVFILAPPPKKNKLHSWESILVIRCLAKSKEATEGLKNGGNPLSKY